MTIDGNLSRLQVPEFILKGTPSCSEIDPELFFPQENVDFNGDVRGKYIDLAGAKRICDGCPLRIDCLEYALNNTEIGIWGGTTEEQRNQIKRSSRRKAIRKSRRPDIW